MQKSPKNKWMFFAAVAIVGFALDIFTKHLVAANLEPYQSIPLAGDILEVFFVYNKGAIFGINPRGLVPGFPVNLFFYVFSSIAVVLLLVYYRTVDFSNTLLRWGVALIMPGALGNLYDRIAHPDLGVVDFIKVDLGFWPFNPWPIFNFADIYITVGVLLVLLEFVREERRKNSSERTSADSPDTSRA
jgi:signal peptidase II